MSPRIVIIGGVAGGMSAATRARRMNETASITVLEKSGYVSFANCGLPYYIAGQIATKDKLLVTTAQALKRRYNIDARVKHEALRIDRTRKVVQAIDHSTGLRLELPYDKLILAPGANPIVPPIEHINSANVFFLRSMEDTSAIQQWIEQERPKSAVIVGAGFIGLEMAEALTQRGIKTTIVEKAPHPLPLLDSEMAMEIRKELAAHQVDLLTGEGLASLEAGARVHAVKTESGRTIPTDMVLLSIGVRPNVALAQAAGLKLGLSGAIAVDEFQRTSDPDIYAVGDASQSIHGVTGLPVRIPLAGPANRQGRLAGEHAAAGFAQPAGKVMGSAIVQVFDLQIGLTGLGEAAAKAAGLDADAAYVLPGHHAGFYPGTQQLRLKLIYERKTGRILGAQAAGRAGIDKRLDVIATAMHFGGTIDDLAQLDLAYAPQFASAKDPVHLAAFVAQNQRREITKAIAPAALDGQFLMDVRTSQEVAAGSLPGAVNIPVDELRGRLAELPRDRTIAVFCQVGLRGYIAQRILQQNGFTAANVKGGYAMIRSARN